MEIFAWLNFSFLEHEITACSLQIVYLEHSFMREIDRDRARWQFDIS